MASTKLPDEFFKYITLPDLSFNKVTVSFFALSSLDSVVAGGFVVDDSGVVVSVVVSSGVVVSVGVVDGGVVGSVDGADVVGSVDGADVVGSVDGADVVGSVDGAGVVGSVDGADDVGSADEVGSVILTNAFTKSAGFGMELLSTFS